MAAQKSARGFNKSGHIRKNAKLAGEDNLVSGMAGRYATALFELAHDEGKLEETEQAFMRLEEQIAENKDLQRLVRSPIFSADEQSRALGAVAEKLEISGLAANFLQLLIKNRRLFALQAILAGFHKLAAHQRGEITAGVTTAIPLTDDQTEELKATLKAKTGRDVTLNATVDQAILGGLILTIGSRMIDSSIRTKLNNLKIAMKEVG